MIDYPTIVFAIVWGLFFILITVMLVKSYRKKLKRKQCNVCNGMGFEMSVNTYPPQSFVVMELDLSKN